MSTPQLSPKMSRSDLDKFLSDAFGIASNPFPVDGVPDAACQEYLYFELDQHTHHARGRER